MDFTMRVPSVGVEEIEQLILELPPDTRDRMLSNVFKALSPESRSRILALADSSLTVITGSFVSLNSEVAVNVQNNNSTFDPQMLVKALLDYKHSRKN